MRPYICRSRSKRLPMPADLASFGFDVPVVRKKDGEEGAGGSFDPVGTRGAAAVQINAGGGRNSRAERIAAYLSAPRRGATVSANGLLPKDGLAGMSLPRTIPAPARRPAPLVARAQAAPAVAAPPAIAAPADPGAAGLRPSLPMPRRNPIR